MKIGIVSQFRTQTVNYGNNLQAYALNYFLKKNYPSEQIETLYFQDPCKMRMTAPVRLFIKKLLSCANNMRHGYLRKNSLDPEWVNKRLHLFKCFQKRIQLSPDGITWKKLVGSDYDMLIVGSDVVWAQEHYYVNRIPFLDFKKNIVKVSYAASFGQNWIPKENEDYVRKCLMDFDLISLREMSAIQMLEMYGINGTSHVVDPTLLLTAEEWETIESKPDNLNVESYVFVYLLGTDKFQREMITLWARGKNLPIVTVPYANGLKNEVDLNFGDFKMMDCSPEEWIWLIHHAEHVITDSFHGIVFSTIFERTFFAFSRKFKVDINVRITDYLNTIHQTDKIIPEKCGSISGDYTWNYDLINLIICEKRKMSEDYLKDALSIPSHK